MTLPGSGDIWGKFQFFTKLWTGKSGNFLEREYIYIYHLVGIIDHNSGTFFDFCQSCERKSGNNFGNSGSFLDSENWGKWRQYLENRESFYQTERTVWETQFLNRFTRFAAVEDEPGRLITHSETQSWQCEISVFGSFTFTLLNYKLTWSCKQKSRVCVCGWGCQNKSDANLFNFSEAWWSGASFNL